MIVRTAEVMLAKSKRGEIDAFAARAFGGEVLLSDFFNELP
jgi:hypothetical protein